MIAIETISDNCGACRICELACSHHHVREFGRQVSSIEIFKIDAMGKAAIRIHQTATDGHRACDRCEQEDEPLCVKWCPAQALTVRKEV